MKDFGLLLLRLTLGGLLAGHGAQKLFGTFDGAGLDGTAKHMEKLGLSPGHPWASLAGASELGSGILTAFGLFHPVGPLATFGPMAVAWFRAHGDKPIWSNKGGGELPLTDISIATALVLIGPGRISLDHAFGIRVPLAVRVLVAGSVAAGALTTLTQPKPAETKAQAREPSAV